MKKLALILAIFSLPVWTQAAEIKFQGFDGTFITIGPMAGTFAEFELTVNHPPFHFRYRGKVNAGVETRNLRHLLEDIVVVVSYFDAPVTDVPGGPRVAALSELIFFLDDEPAKLDGGTFILMPPLEGRPSAMQALANVPAMRNIYIQSGSREAREVQEDSDITIAMADPWNKGVITMEQLAIQKAAEDRRADSLRAIQRAQADRKKADSPDNVQPRRQRRRVASPDHEQADQAATPGRRSTLTKQQNAEEEEVVEQPVVRRKKRRPAPETGSRDYGDVDWADQTPARKTGLQDPEFRRTMGWVGAGITGVAAIATLKFQSDAARANDERNLHAPLALSNPASLLAYNNADQQRVKNETNRNISLVGVLLAGGFTVMMFYF